MAKQIPTSDYVKLREDKQRLIEALELTLETLNRVYTPKGEFSSIQGTIDVARKAIEIAEGF